MCMRHASHPALVHSCDLPGMHVSCAGSLAGLWLTSLLMCTRGSCALQPRRTAITTSSAPSSASARTAMHELRLCTWESDVCVGACVLVMSGRTVSGDCSANVGRWLPVLETRAYASLTWHVLYQGCMR